MFLAGIIGAGMAEHHRQLLAASCLSDEQVGVLIEKLQVAMRAKRVSFAAQNRGRGQAGGDAPADRDALAGYRRVGSRRGRVAPARLAGKAARFGNRQRPAEIIALGFGAA